MQTSEKRDLSSEECDWFAHRNGMCVWLENFDILSKEEMGDEERYRITKDGRLRKIGKNNVRRYDSHRAVLFNVLLHTSCKQTITFDAFDVCCLLLSFAFVWIVEHRTNCNRNWFIHVSRIASNRWTQYRSIIVRLVSPPQTLFDCTVDSE